MTSPQAESKDREQKDKDAVGKITGSGTGNTYMGRLNTDRSTGDRNSCHSQDVTVASYDPIVQNTIIHGLQKSSSDGSISLTGSKTFAGPVAVTISSSGTIQVSVVVAEKAIVDGSIKGSFLISLTLSLSLSFIHSIILFLSYTFIFLWNVSCHAKLDIIAYHNHVKVIEKGQMCQN